LADLAKRLWLGETYLLRSALEFTSIIALLVALVWAAGFFDISSGHGAGGFGFYRMNLLAPFNPLDWSYVLRPLSNPPGQYEGFNYFGLGGLLLPFWQFAALYAVTPMQLQLSPY
jgi:Family of unknown function (DUF6311)